MLGVNTKWRQGDLLSKSETSALGLGVDSKCCVVLISHDCDIANDIENYVEVIVGESVGSVDPMKANARSPRKLHLKYTSNEHEAAVVELTHAERRQISKEVFSKLTESVRDFIISAEEKRALKQWLAARYGRPAFPNAFEKHLRKIASKKKNVEYHLAKIIEPVSSYLVAILFDLGEDKTVELEAGQAYSLSISIVYDAVEGGSEARERAEKVAEEIKTLFEGVYGAPSDATEIALEACTAVADISVTLADIRRVDQWRLEYISLRDGPVSDFIATAELPV